MSESEERTFPVPNVSPAVDWMGPRELENRITKLETTVNIMRWIVGILLTGVVGIAGWSVVEALHG